MKNWKIATIRNVDLKIHYSIIFLFLYILFIMRSKFVAMIGDAGLKPNELAGTPLTWSGILAFALFVSITVHEFAHVLMAQKFGIKVSSITLMMLGGIAEMQRIPAEKLIELKVAIIGPVISLMIAMVCYSIATIADSPEIVFLFHWIAQINLIIAIFNLLPIFPLDGGRSLRSIMTMKYGRRLATARSLKIAKAGAWLLGISAILTLNLFVLLIALFIYSAAMTEYVVMSESKAQAQDIVRHHFEPIAVIEPETTLKDCAQLMLDQHHNVLPINYQSDGRGAIIKLSQILKYPLNLWPIMTVASIMEFTDKPAYVEDLVEKYMADLAVSQYLPVITGQQKIIGILELQHIKKLLELKHLSLKLQDLKMSKTASAA